MTSKLIFPPNYSTTHIDQPCEPEPLEDEEEEEDEEGPFLPGLETLFPIHDLILYELVNLIPLKTLTLSADVYRLVIPRLYRQVKVSEKFLRGLSRSTGKRRKIDNLRFVKDLKIVNTQAMWMLLSTLRDVAASGFDMPYCYVFPNVERIFFTPWVLEAIYVYRTGPIIMANRGRSMLLELRNQVPPSCVFLENWCPPETIQNLRINPPVKIFKPETDKRTFRDQVSFRWILVK